MNHAPIVPVILPALVAALMLIDRRIGSQRALAWLSAVLVAGCAVWMLTLAADGWRSVYLVGNWAAPWGIVLVADRLSVLMVALTSLLALITLATVQSGWDRRGEHFHPLMQIQLMGLNGAFLTGDLFNLFVFFEALLIASYGLLVHGDGSERIRAGLTTVTLNLVGSALFLIAASLLYGVTGTLNFADLALRVAQLDSAGVTLAHTGALLLLTVFCLKAAILPLGFWLPGTYGPAGPAVAAFFAVMTKVGIYAVLRLFTLVFGASAGALAEVAFPWIVAPAAAGYLLAMICALAGTDLRKLASVLVMASAAFLLIGIGRASEASIAAAVYYLPHTTLSAAALFLVAGLVVRSRGERAGDRLVAGPAPLSPALVGGLFFLSAVAVAGMPPFGGFIGKAMLLLAILPDDGLPGTIGTIGWLWFIILAGSLLGLIALARAGSTLFWKSDGPAAPDAGSVSWRDALPAAITLAVIAALAIGSAPLQRYAQATAQDLLQTDALIDDVLTTVPRPGPHQPSPQTYR
jgi:multicomponent K+:H+ antiporter subunit D